MGNKLPTLHGYGVVWPIRWDTMTDMRRNALRLLRPTAAIKTAANNPRAVAHPFEFRRVGSLLPTRSTRAAQSTWATSCPPYLAYPAREVVPTLRHLRRLLPSPIQIWAGGSGLAGIRKPPKGVRIFSQFNEVVDALCMTP